MSPHACLLEYLLQLKASCPGRDVQLLGAVIQFVPAKQQIRKAAFARRQFIEMPQ